MDLFDSLKKSSHIGQKNIKYGQKNISGQNHNSNTKNDNRLSLSTKNHSKQEDSKISSNKKDLKSPQLSHKKSNDLKPKSVVDQRLTKFNDKNKTHSSSSRRESMPSPVLHNSIISKSKNKKARSLSPPQFVAKNAIIKSLKVKVERKNLEDFLKVSKNLPAKITKLKAGKQKDSKEQSKQKSPFKVTPTKAQQKLFEPVGSKKSKAQILKDYNIKKCVVRIHRDNLKKLMNNIKSSNSANENPTKPRGRPRKNDELDDTPLAKRAKMSFPPKTKTNFFIKFNNPKLDKKSKPFTRPISSTSSSSVAHHNKIRNSKFLGNTTPTKFSRSHLIRSFGERFFSSFVRIEKCTHPLLLTFESNDRARSLKAKRNKSKNLSVSFREQVEVFGDTSDSDNSVDENFSVLPQALNQKAGAGGTPGRRASNNSQAIVSSTPVVMPARLKKVENGKVIDDIELDPSLFLDPKNLVASTPYSPGRKKRDHKSFSPLKDESSPSPRKEQLKLANEKIPPSGLRRLNIDEDDDEDDDCEYIVPIELPQRRTSQASSTNTLDSGPTLNLPPPPPEDIPISIPITAQRTEELKKKEEDKNSYTKETVSPPKKSSLSLPTVEAKSPSPPPKAASPIPPSPEEDSPMRPSPKEASPTPLSPKEASPTPLSPKEVSPTPPSPKEASPTPTSPKEVSPTPPSSKEASPTPLSPREASPTPLSPREVSPTPPSPKEASPTPSSPKEASPTPLSPKEASPTPSSLREAPPTPPSPKETSPTPPPIVAASASPLANLDTSPISSTSMPDLSDTESNPVTNIASLHLEKERAEEKEPSFNPGNDDNVSNESFQSAKDHEVQDHQPTNGKQYSNEKQLNHPNPRSPSFALKDVFDRVAASVMDAASETPQPQKQQQQQPAQDINEINGTGVSLNDMPMNLFIEDDSRAEDDSPEKSFVDSIINETIDKLGKDIGEGNPVDEQYTHAT